ncbi:MAG TPA: DUF4097 family beta strand repeat-containing protein [Kofleriaceae bacterium]|jgi:hypothetical protein
MWRVLLILCASAAPVLAQPAQPAKDSSVVERSRVEVAPAGQPFKQLQIDNPLGDVRIEGYDGTAIRIETHKHAPDEDTLDRLRVSLVPNPDGTVRITTSADKTRESKPVAASAVRIDLVIRAPRNAKVDASVIAGKLELEGMDAGGELDAASGPISVKNVSGEVWTHSVSGATSLVQVFGSVDAAAISADVDLDTIGGERLVASVNRGRIAGRRVRARDIELTTTEGKILLEAEAALHGRLVITSLRGDVDVRLRRHGPTVVRGFGTKVDLGAPMHQLPGGWMTSSFGEGIEPAVVELRSRYGFVQFVAID